MKGGKIPMNYTKKEIRENRIEVLLFILSTIAILFLIPKYLTSNYLENVISFMELVTALIIQIPTGINILSKIL